jgi:hypothetical protein
MDTMMRSAVGLVEVRDSGELQSPDAKGTGPFFGQAFFAQTAISGRKMDQSPDIAVLLTRDSGG